MNTKFIFLPVRLCFFALALTAMAASCSTPINVEGTNTNWLHCKTDADCTFEETGAMCVAGYCTAVDGGKLFAQSNLSETCALPKSLVGDAAVNGTCNAYPNIIACADPGTLGPELCVDQSGVHCPGSGDNPCTSVCRADEYAAWCDSESRDPLSAGCRSVTISTFRYIYCCPCGS